MRLTLGTLAALTLLLTGCGAGQEPDDRAADPTLTSAPTPTQTPTVSNGPVEFTQVAMVSESNVGGSVGTRAIVLDGDDAVTEFAGQFDDSRMGEALSAAVAEADVPTGESLVGAVVAIACDPPVEVFVEQTSGGLQISAGKVPTDKQCLVPVTTVALVSVDLAVV